MAARFWRGTTSTDWHNTGNWSATSGGATGASIPTAADDVTFNNLGNLYCIVTAAAVCNNFTQTSGYTARFDHDNQITISGSLSMSSSIDYKGNTITGTWVFNSTSTGNTINSGGETLHYMIFDGAGGEWTLGAALTINSGWAGIRVNNGTFKSGGFAITCADISAGAGTKGINLSTSTLTLSNSGGTAVDFTTNSTNLTLTSSSATFVFTGASTAASFGSGATVASLQATSLTGTLTLTLGTISGNCIVGPSAYGQRYARLCLVSNLTVSGTFYTTNTVTDHDTRFHVYSSVKGTQRTLSIATFGLFGTPSRNIDWEDIAVTGAASPLASGTHHGDGGNCSGINPRGATTYYRSTAGNFSAAATWSSTYGGAGGAGVPILQDTINMGGGGGTYTIDIPRIGTLNGLNFTGTLINTGTVELWIYGTFELVALYMTFSLASTGAIRFRPNGTKTLYSGGWTYVSDIHIEAGVSGSSLTLTYRIYTTGNLVHTIGTFNSAGYDVAAATLSSSTSYTRSLTTTNSTVTLAGTGNVLYLAASGLTFTGTSSSIYVTDASTTTKNLYTAGQTFFDITLGDGGGGVCTYFLIGGMACTYLTISKSSACTVQMDWFFVTWAIGAITGNGTAGNVITWKTSTAGTQTAVWLTGATPCVLKYWDIKDIYMGWNSTYPDLENQLHVWNGTDSGNNLNIKFMPRDVILGALTLLGVGT